MESLFSKIPKLFAKISIISDTLQALDKSLLDAEAKTNQVENDFALNNVSDINIGRYEKIFDIDNQSLTLDQRREALLSKYRGAGTITREHLKRVALSFGYGEIDVKENVDGAYVITITFVDIKGIPTHVLNFKKALREVMPSHLDIKYVFTYLTWDEFDAYNKTFDAWDSLLLTWDDFEKYKEVT